MVDLYGCRWSIETFSKELKQTVQLVDILGHSANAVRWQVWTALLVHRPKVAGAGRECSDFAE